MKKLKNKLAGKRIVLKMNKAKLSNAKDIFETVDNNRKHLRRWLAFEKNTKTIEDSLKYLLNVEEQMLSGKKFDYGIYIENQYIGNIGIFDISEKNKSVEIGYWLSDKFAKNGYMTEAVKIVEKELFLNLGINRIKIKCDERNKASIGVAKKCAYKLEGRHR